MVSRIHYDSIPSTQTEAKKHFGELTEKGAWRVYTASSQTQGQGTHGRDWHSPIGNIYASYIFLVPKNIAGTTLPHLAQIGAISVAEVLDNHGVSSTIKWVNDVLINGKKAAGLLPQAETQGDYFGVCMGVGVNVNVELSQLSHIAQPATSVKAETGKELPLDRLIDELSNRIYDNVTRLMREGYAPFQQAMNARLERFGGFPIIFDREVVKEGETPYYVGTITGVGNNGSLLLKEVNGEKQTCITGRILKGREIEPALQNVGVLDSLYWQNWRQTQLSTPSP
jgi:BirA family biotin operon repressor/biotin-[acetyl-CoA-carboxylase] ligase